MTRTDLPRTFSRASLTSAAAHDLLRAAQHACRDLGIEVAIAVTDAAGHLKAFERSDGAPFLAIDVAIDKAWTAASFGLATHVWNGIVANADVAPLAYRPRVVAVGGGVPVFHEGQLAGAIGISGGNALQDQQAAEAALGALGFAWTA